MRIRRMLIAGVVSRIAGTILGIMTCGWLFNWVYALEPTEIWKPMAGPPPLWFNLAGLALGIILALVYALLIKSIPGKGIVKGLVFGLFVWLVGILPGMLATYTFMRIATTVVIYWTIQGLVVLLVEGVIIAAIYGNPEE
ncbi:hypothetical protein KJ693_03880 [bacterium]|nr:hypothetical protein [bacterium]MBU1614433.1 hypothetical protein [bacterium]